MSDPVLFKFAWAIWNPRVDDHCDFCGADKEHTIRVGFTVLGIPKVIDLPCCSACMGRVREELRQAAEG